MRERHAELTLLHVSSPGETSIDIERLLRPGQPPPAFLHCTAPHDGTAAAILKLEDGYDLIVIGAEHKAFRDVTIFGATTASVTRHARTPVLVVTRQAEETRPPASRRAVALTE